MEIQKSRLSRRTFLRVSGMIALGMLVSACPAPQASQATESETEAEAGADAEGVEVLYMFWTDPEQLKVQEAITEAFHDATPGVRVKLESMAWDGYWDKLQTMVAGGIAPDMFRMDYVLMAAWGSKGVPIALDDYVEAEIDKSLFADGHEMVFKAYQYDGNQYALPQDVNTQVLFYNKRLFDEAGVDYPNESWKWDPSTGGDFVAAAQALTKENQWGYTQDWYWEPIGPWLWENGGDWYDAELTKSTMSNPETVGAIQFLSDLLLKYGVSPTPAQMADRSADSLFSTGLIAMYQTGRWLVPTMRAVADLEWDVAVLPEGPTGRNTMLGGTASCISNQSQRPQETWAYAKWYLTDQAQTMIADLALSTPLVKSVLESQTFLESVPPDNNSVWQQSMAWLRPMPVDENFAQVDDIRGTEFTEIWAGRKSVEDACLAMDEQINALMA